MILYLAGSLSWWYWGSWWKNLYFLPWMFSVRCCSRFFYYYDICGVSLEPTYFKSLKDVQARSFASVFFFLLEFAATREGKRQPFAFCSYRACIRDGRVQSKLTYVWYSAFVVADDSKVFDAILNDKQTLITISLKRYRQPTLVGALTYAR